MTNLFPTGFRPAFKLARLFIPIISVLFLAGCGATYKGAVEESLASSIKFSSITVTTEGAKGRMEVDNTRMAEVAPAVKAALQARLKDRLRPSNANAYPLTVRITYVDIPSTVTTGMNLYGGRLGGKAIVTAKDGTTILAQADILAAPKAVGPNKSSINGIPVGFILSAVATAAVRPDGLKPLSGVFADETRKALIGK